MSSCSAETPKALEMNRWVSLPAGMLLQSCLGLHYSWGVYSQRLKSVLGLSQEAIDGLASAKDFGELLGLTGGLLYPVVPTWALVIAGVSGHLIGYVAVWLTVTGQVLPPVFLLGLFIFFANGGDSTLDVTIMASSLQNFEAERGKVFGLLKSQVGLSAAIFVQMYNAFIQPSMEGFLLLITLVPALIALAFLPVIRRFPIDPVDEADEKGVVDRLRYAYVVVIFLALYLMANILLRELVPVSHPLRIVLTVGMLIILASLFAIPVAFRGRQALSYWPLPAAHASKGTAKASPCTGHSDGDDEQQSLPRHTPWLLMPGSSSSSRSSSRRAHESPQQSPHDREPDEAVGGGGADVHEGPFELHHRAVHHDLEKHDGGQEGHGPRLEVVGQHHRIVEAQGRQHHQGDREKHQEAYQGQQGLEQRHLIHGGRQQDVKLQQQQQQQQHGKVESNAAAVVGAMAQEDETSDGTSDGLQPWPVGRLWSVSGGTMAGSAREGEGDIGVLVRGRGQETRQESRIEPWDAESGGVTGEAVGRERIRSVDDGSTAEGIASSVVQGGVLCGRHEHVGCSECGVWGGGGHGRQGGGGEGKGESGRGGGRAMMGTCDGNGGRELEGGEMQQLLVAAAERRADRTTKEEGRSTSGQVWEAADMGHGGRGEGGSGGGEGKLDGDVGRGCSGGGVRDGRTEGGGVVSSLLSLDFWLLFLAMGCGSGSGLAVINNLAQMGRALGSHEVEQFVALISVWNCFGRLWAGYSSDVAVSAGLPRPLVLLIAVACMGASHLLLSTADVAALSVGSILVGTSYGAFWALLPAIVADIFGLRNFGGLYKTCAISLPLFGYVLSLQVAGVLYDEEVEEYHRQHPEEDQNRHVDDDEDDDDRHSCFGKACFRSTLLIFAGVCLCGALSAALLTWRTKHLYRKKAVAVKDGDDVQMVDMASEPQQAV